MPLASPSSPAVADANVLRELASGELQAMRVSVDLYHRMMQAGLLPDDDPTTELIGGMITYKERGDPGARSVGHGDDHAKHLRLLVRALREIDASQFTVQVQLPVMLDEENEPEPDVAILNEPEEQLAGKPNAAHAAVVFEVAGSSLHMDRQVKSRIYASAGIPQYVLINIAAETVEVHEQPEAAEYSHRFTLRSGEDLSLRLSADKTISIDTASLFA